MKKGAAFILLLSIASMGYSQITTIDSLQRIVALQRHDSTELSALLNLTNEFSRKDFNQAMHYAYQAIVLARNQNSKVNLASGFLYMVVLHQSAGRLDSATHYLNLVAALSKENPSDVKIRINYNQTAGLFYKNQGQYRVALPFMLDNLNLLTTENEGRAGQFLNLGNNYFNMGEYKNAVSNHLQGLTLFEKLKNKRGQSFCLQSLGTDFFSLNQFEQARKYFLLSYKLKNELGDKRGMITSSTGLGDAYKELGKLEISMTYYTRALKTSREMKFISEESRCLFQLGLLYKRMNDLSKARSNISTALQLAKQTGDSTLSAKMRGELMGLEFQQSKDKEIETTHHSNINTLIISGDRSAEALEYSRLSEYYASKNQFDKAFYYLKKHEQLKDSIEGTTVLLQIKQLEEQYESDKKGKEIELLKKDRELHTLALSRERTNVSLIAIALMSVIIIGGLLINRYRVMNRAKRLLEVERIRNNIARDLHDDIGSTLSSINILSQVALVEQNGNTPTYLKRIGDQSARMMEDMSDMVWSINPRNDSMDKVITRMREFATEIFDSAGIDYQFSEKIKDGLTLNADTRKNLFLIFKETINNAAKYSKATSVEIELSQQGEILLLRIKDNGQGFDEQKVNAGNGLSNLRERAKEINGVITLSSKNGEGTVWELKLPVA